MKKSELIAKLMKSLKKNGDEHLREVKLVTLDHGESFHLLSPTRSNKNGYKMKMNHKEFVKYCEENPIKKTKRAKNEKKN